MSVTRKVVSIIALVMLVGSVFLTAQAQTETPITIGDMLEGELTSATPFALYTIESRAGDILDVTLRSSDFDSYLTLSGPDGSSLSTDDDTGGGKDARIFNFEIPADGLYTLKVESYNQVSTGTFTLIVGGSANDNVVTATLQPTAAVASSGGSLTYGDSAEGSISSDTVSIAYTFEGQAGDSVTINLSSPDFDAYVVLQDGSGAELVSDDDSAGSLNARIEDYSLPADGTYTIQAGSAFGGVNGSFTLSLESGAAVDATPIATATDQSPVTTSAIFSGTLSENQYSASYPFEGQAGDQVTFTLSSQDFDAYLILQDSAGKILAEDDDGGGGVNAQIANFSLPSDGRYSLIATSANRAQTGDYTLEAEGAALEDAVVVVVVETTPTPAATVVAQQGGEIQAGSPVTGELSSDSPTASYTYSASSTEVVTITLISDDFDTFVSLQDANGTGLTSDDDSAGNLNSRIENYPLPSSGVYTIGVSSAGGAFTGNFTLTLETEATVEPTAQPTFEPSGSGLQFGESVAGTLEGDASSTTYTFEGAAGTVVTISVDSADFDSFVTLSDDNQVVLVTDDDTGGNLNARIENYELPSNGVYSVTVGSFDDSGRGDYTIILETGSTIQPTVEPTRVPDGSQIALGDTISGELRAGQTQATYTFQGEAGQPISISLISPDFDAYLRLQDSTGYDLITDDDGGSDLNARIAIYTLPSNGTYTVVVESYDGNSGSYTLSLSAAQTEAIAYGETVSGTLENGGDVVVYRFDGNEGDAVTIKLTSPDFDTQVSLSDAAGGGYPLIENDDGGNDGTNSYIGPYALLADGTYLINVSSYDSAATGRYTLTLSSAALTPIAYDETVEANFGDGVSTIYYSFEGKNGDVINVSVEGGGLDTALTLTGPDNYQIIFDDNGGSGVNPEIYRQLLTLDGIYTLTFQLNVIGDSGQAALTLSKSALRSLDDGPQEVRLSSEVYQDVVTFTGNAGETVRLTIDFQNPDGQSSPYLTVTQNGVTIAYGSGTTVSGLTIEFVVPEDGAVNVQIVDYSYRSDVARVSIERVEQ